MGFGTNLKMLWKYVRKTYIIQVYVKKTPMF